MEITMDQVRELADRYEQAGLGESSSGRFLRSIVKDDRMPRGGGISWLNDLMMKGDPSTVGPLVDEIEDLIERSGRQDTIETLNEILRQVKAGRVLSDRRKIDLERLREQVNGGQIDLDLTEKQRNLLAGLAALKHFGSSFYWASRPAISTRLDTIFRRWGNEGKVSPDDWEFVRQNFRAAVSDFEDGKHPVGALRWTRWGEAATVMGEPRFDERGHVLIDVMTPAGGVRATNPLGLLKRMPK